MRPGPDEILACPHCKGLEKHRTLMSGNTFGASVWTDGKQIAPMLPLPPAVVRCSHCAAFYWLSDAEKVGAVDLWREERRQGDPAWTAAPYVQEPVEEQYYEALESGLAVDLDQQRALRILAWWRRNDAYRDLPRTQPGGIATATAAGRKNLEELVSLLDADNESNAVMKAELLRELGEFESARHVLDSVASADYAAVVCQLRSLCDNGDTCVRELQFDA